MRFWCFSSRRKVSIYFELVPKYPFSIVSFSNNLRSLNRGCLFIIWNSELSFLISTYFFSIGATLAKSFLSPTSGKLILSSWVLPLPETSSTVPSPHCVWSAMSPIDQATLSLALERLLLPKGRLEDVSALGAACLLRSWRAWDRLMPFPNVVPLPLL